MGNLYNFYQVPVYEISNISLIYNQSDGQSFVSGGFTIKEIWSCGSQPKMETKNQKNNSNYK